MHGQRIIAVDAIDEWVSYWLTSCRARNLSPRTVSFYNEKIAYLQNYCRTQSIRNVGDIRSQHITDMLDRLRMRHNPGGLHAIYRTVKTFLRWYWEECEPSHRNPISKVRAPIVPRVELDPVSLDDVRAMLAACANNPAGLRDKALILFLLDTGARAAEALAVDLADVDDKSGRVVIRHGKGRKQRSVYLGRRARQALRAYLRTRTDGHPALWVNKQSDRLAYYGLRSMLIRRASGIDANPSPHGFRRAFALAMLRGGADVFTVQRLMGHADLQVLRRYLAQTEDDLREAHERAAPGKLV